LGQRLLLLGFGVDMVSHQKNVRKICDLFPHEKKKRVTSTLKNHLSRVSLFFSIAKNERLRSRKTADARTKRTSETRSIFCADKDSRLHAFTRVFIAARAWKISAIFTPGAPLER